MPKPRKLRKLGDSPCAPWIAQVAENWIDGMGPGGPKTAFPSMTARIASGQTILKVASGCMRATPLYGRLEAKLNDEIRAAKRRRE
jgi:hypothetical protein